MKKIFLYAYDHINLGDDLFIETIANRYSDTEIYFWTNAQNQKAFEEQKNLKIIDENSTKTKILKKIRPSLAARYKAGIQKKCDAQVYIGGSIFMEKYCIMVGISKQSVSIFCVRSEFRTISYRRISKCNG